jgi:hypothetical protein
MSGTTSRAKAQAQLLHWRDNIFGLEGPLLKWFNGQTFSRIEDFTKMTDQEVHGIEYKDEDGCSIAAPRHHRAQLKASIGYFHYVTYHHHGIDVMYCRDVVNAETFDKFFTRDYDPSKPTVRYTPEYIEALERKKKLIEREYELHMMRMSIERKKLSSMNFRYTRMGDEEEPCHHEVIDVEDNGTFTRGIVEASDEKYEVLEATSEEFLQSIRAEDKVNIEITDSVNTLHGVKNMIDLCGSLSVRKDDPINKMMASDTDINCTRILYGMTKDKSTDSLEKNGLVDRGASGALAVTDLRHITPTDRWIDMTSINDIQSDNVRTDCFVKHNTHVFGIHGIRNEGQHVNTFNQLQKHHIFVKCGYPPPAGYKLVITRNTCRDDFLDTELMTTTAATTKYNQR